MKSRNYTSTEEAARPRSIAAINIAVLSLSRRGMMCSLQSLTESTVVRLDSGY